MTGAANTRSKLLLAAGLLLLSVAALLTLGQWRDDAPAPTPGSERRDDDGSATTPADAAGDHTGAAATGSSEPTSGGTNDAQRDDAVRRVDAPRSHAPTSLTVQLRDADSGELLVGYLVAIARVGALDTLAEAITWTPTDARGEVRRLDLEPGRYAIQLARRGRMQNVDLLPGDARHEVLELPDGGAIVGTVLRADGQPAKGAEVFRADETLPEPVVARTGDDGRFLLRHSRPLRLRARLAGHAPSDAQVASPTRGPELLTLRLGDANRRVTGVVRDEDDRPLADATIAMLRPDARVADRLWLRADAQGRFATDELQAAEYVVFAADPARAHLPTHVAADLRAGDADVVLRCPKPSRLSGRVQTGRTHGLYVLTTRRGTGHVARLYDLATRTHEPLAADGTFSLLVPAGDVIARVARDGRVVARTELQVAAGERREWNPEVADGTPLRVEVTSWTALPPELRVVVPNPINPWMPTKAALDEHGAAELMLDGDEPFDLDLLLELPDGRTMTLLQRRAVPRDQRTLRLELLRPQLPITHVTGRLVDPSRRPLADRELLISREDGDMELWIRFHSGADGAFSVGPLPPGTYAIETDELQDYERWQQIAVPGGKRLELGDLVADPD